MVTAPLEPPCLVSPVPRNTCSIRLRAQPLDGLLHWFGPRVMPGRRRWAWLQKHGPYTRYYLNHVNPIVKIVSARPARSTLGRAARCCT